jgi:hypothetical protein
MSQSRRDFIAHGVSWPLLSALGAGRARAQSAPGQATSAAAPVNTMFPRPDVIRYDAQCFTIRGVDTFIYSLECPYPRVAPAEWRDRFVAIRQAGFNTLSTYIFWNYHERSPGQFDFSELEQFLALAQEFGFFVIARPGPYVDAEFDRGGFPTHVIAERFALRTMDPKSLRSSRYWYQHVLPLIRRYQITAGGPIILMQIENEIDFSDRPVTEQREYLRFLARLAWNAGIEVPLISNVSTSVRDPHDPELMRILDVCDFYPRWSFLTDNELPASTAGLTTMQKVDLSDHTVLASLRKMRRDEPQGPLSVAELGTGYYSKFGGKLPEDEEGADATQLNALTKTILEHGVTYLNFYLGWGGSNRRWGGRGVTSTYDFAAPIRECGGLWGKYYEIKAVGAFLGQFGALLVRSVEAPGASRTNSPDVSVSQRNRESRGFVFLRANTDADHHCVLTITDPLDGRELTVPRHGRLTLAPHAMKILALRVPLGDATLLYCSGEILAQGRCGQRDFMVVYDVPGSVLEMALELGAPPAGAAPVVSGERAYSEWDAGRRRLICGMVVGEAQRELLVDGRFLIIVLPRALALHSWAGSGTVFVSDAYCLRSASRADDRITAEIDYLPGAHSLAIVLPAAPSRCLVDGRETPGRFDASLGLLRLEFPVPEPPVQPNAGQQASVRMNRRWVERLAARGGTWQRSAGRALEDLGPIPYGYVKYRGSIAFDGQRNAYLRAFTNNDKQVFINGRWVPEGSQPDRFVMFAAAPYLVAGINTVEIVYEMFGGADFGETAHLGELNGIDAFWLGSDGEREARIDDWQVQSVSNTGAGDAMTLAAGTIAESAPPSAQSTGDRARQPSFTWCEANLALPALDADWSVPWYLQFDADTDALIFLDDVLLGRYTRSGPQYRFYLPSALLRTSSSHRLTLLLAYTDTTDVIRTCEVQPYREYSTRRVRIECRYP